jgi:hypothetical protein
MGDAQIDFMLSDRERFAHFDQLADAAAAEYRRECAERQARDRGDRMPEPLGADGARVETAVAGTDGLRRTA